MTDINKEGKVSPVATATTHTKFATINDSDYVELSLSSDEDEEDVPDDYLFSSFIVFCL